MIQCNNTQAPQRTSLEWPKQHLKQDLKSFFFFTMNQRCFLYPVISTLFLTGQGCTHFISNASWYFCKKGSLTKRKVAVVDPELKAEQHILNQFPCLLKSISFKLITKQL